MKRLSLLLLLSLVAITACSKQKKIEKNLYKKGGDWEITQYIYAYGSMNPTINSYSTGTYYNCGKFHFSKDGSGTVTITADGETSTASFFYNNTENKLTIVYDTYTQVYNMDWSKDVISINYDESTTDPDGYQDIDRESIVLEKSR